MPGWRASNIPFNLTYYRGGDTPDQGMTYDQAVDPDCQQLYQTRNYTFTGWNTQPDGRGTTYANRPRTVSNLTPEEGGTVITYAPM